MKPRLLDLFCGAGGCSVGYARAGFDVVGVDINPQPNYPYEFGQADALSYLGEIMDPQWCWTGYRLADFDAIHASPPCQAYTTLRSVRQDYDYPDLLAPTRVMLEQTGLPYVIENVPGSPISGSLMLCGSSFNLGSNGRYLRRHRYFELNWPLHTLVPPCDHRLKGAILVAGHTSMKTHKPSGQPRSYQGSRDERAEAMGIDWMTTGEIAEAIPPAYTEFIGHQLLAHITQEVAA